MKFCFSRTIRTAESEGYQVRLGEDNIASLSIHYGKVTYAEYFFQEEVGFQKLASFFCKRSEGEE